MKAFLLSLLVLGGAGLAYAAEGELKPAPPERFAFVAMGCMPYGKQNFAAYERLLTEIDRRRPAFVVHCGDTKGGSEPPTEEFLVQVKTWFNSLNGAVIYTPGDNEWTDVNRENNGKEDPLVWLAKVRKTYFSDENSMGRMPIPLVTQRRDPQYAKFVENARWSRGNVVFATVHVVGSNNNCQPKVPGAMEEFHERDRANAAWIHATFEEARATHAAGVALFFQAEPFKSLENSNRESGFNLFLQTIEAEADKFAKPVLLVHADEHRYRLERAPRFRRDGDPLPNVTRLETFGANDIHATFVVVDASSPHVFLAGPLIVPDNALPMLPKKK